MKQREYNSLREIEVDKNATERDLPYDFTKKGGEPSVKTSSGISDLISSQLAGVDSYLELKKREYALEMAAEATKQEPTILDDNIDPIDKLDGDQILRQMHANILKEGSSGGLPEAD